jgi:DNA-binding SARP family transcriptional activator
MGKVVRIQLFGAFAVRVGDEAVPEGAWRLRKAKSLVKLLALAPERRVHRERAMELLWPERAPDAAANNFHQALYVARRALEAAGAEASAVLPLRDDMLALYPGGAVEVDVDAFEAAAARARETGELPDYHAALRLHGGELLPEDRYEGWAAGRREALSEARALARAARARAADAPAGPDPRSRSVPAALPSEPAPRDRGTKAGPPGSPSPVEARRMCIHLARSVIASDR